MGSWTSIWLQFQALELLIDWPINSSIDSSKSRRYVATPSGAICDVSPENEGQLTELQNFLFGRWTTVLVNLGARSSRMLVSTLLQDFSTNINVSTLERFTGKSTCNAVYELLGIDCFNSSELSFSIVIGVRGTVVLCLRLTQVSRLNNSVSFLPHLVKFTTLQQKAMLISTLIDLK